MNIDPPPRSLRIVILGLSITSSWGNGHATTYRALVRALAERAHRVTFLERDLPWYAANRDLAAPPYGETWLYASLGELKRRFGGIVADADLIIVGSFVPQGVVVGEWAIQQSRGVTAFYDIDTPVTLAMLAAPDEAAAGPYIAADLIPRYDLYLSFTGGPVLDELEERYGARAARPLYCSVDSNAYAPLDQEPRWDLGYMGTYSGDRQPALERLLCAPARAWRQGRFAVAGPQYPASIAWPANVERIEHLPPDRHRAFYARQRYALNVTRAPMVRAGWSPSVRLFEAAACGTPVISDRWPGIESFFVPGQEILLADSAAEALGYLRDLRDAERRQLGAAARCRVLASHTAAHRAAELEAYVREAQGASGNLASAAIRAMDRANAP
ncbi:MAG: glycosyltransferase [Rhodospirillales bacterium]|jgi:spore maturation protein CgeB|nr:glycosyltransferase [Rhodospirillales bacterium]